MWTVTECFVGESCWCGIIVSPEGEACNQYGSISRGDCQYIVDCLNGVEGSEPDHATPWVVEDCGNHKVIVTVDSFGTDDLEGCVALGGTVFGGFAQKFVDAANQTD